MTMTCSHCVEYLNWTFENIDKGINVTVVSIARSHTKQCQRPRYSSHIMSSPSVETDIANPCLPHQVSSIPLHL
jgi:hypothetical protein